MTNMTKMKRKLNLLGLLVLVAVIICFSQFAFAIDQTQQAPAWQASDCIKKSQNTINYMQHKGLNTERVNDLLEDARLYLKQGDNNKVVEICDEINSMKETAILLTEDIDKTKLLIESAKDIGVDVNSIEEQLNSGIEEFEINNYEGAQLNIGQSSKNIKELLKIELKNLIGILDNLHSKTLSENLELEINLFEILSICL